MKIPLILAGVLFAAAVAAFAATAAGNSRPSTVAPVIRPAVSPEASRAPIAGTPSPSGPFAVYSPPPPTPTPRTTPNPTPVMIRPQAPSTHSDEDEGD